MTTENEDAQFLAAITEEHHRSTLAKKPPLPLTLKIHEEEEFKANSDGEFFFGNVESNGSKSPTLTYHEFVKWRKGVLIVSCVSILVQLVVSIISIVEGLKVDSAGTLGFGIETAMDIGTTAIVIWHFYSVQEITASKVKEKITLTVLSLMMCSFSAGVIIKTIYNLYKELKPFNEFKLMVICSIATVLFVFLAWMKLYFSKKIGSKSVEMDAFCTFGTTGMSATLLSSLIVYHFTGLWFLDSIIGILIALIMLFYGARSLFRLYRCCKTV